jgi:NADH dehydrogenase
VIDYDGNEVKFSDGTSIFTKNLIWAAGVTAMVFEGIDASCYGRGKRLIVDAFNKVQSTENIYAIGDTCYMDSDPSFPVGHPQVAQVAIQQGLLLAKNLQKIANPAPFIYNDKGSMAIIGKAKAVADLSPKVHFDGIIAWLAWLVIHIMSLINYRNKLRTLYNWMSAYFSNNSSLRMIVRPQKKML